jgi:NAD(P)H-dependent flavin oxidoreductase YrpB (nitropropane dioxygenase family)
MQLDERGQPIYGERDLVDFAKMREIGLPFWLAGSYATPERLREAQNEIGAVGIQVGTAFALSNESGLQEHYRARIRAQAYRGALEILTDGRASPSGYPFKVAQLENTLSDKEIYEERPRLCDIGRLQELYRKENGTLGMRCPAEPVEDFLEKGGKIEESVGRKCLCNTLFANLGLGQKQPNGYVEPPLFTLGDDHGFLHDIIEHEDQRYSALDVIAYLKGERPPIRSRGLVAAVER